MLWPFGAVILGLGSYAHKAMPVPPPGQAASQIANLRSRSLALTVRLNVRGAGRGRDLRIFLLVRKFVCAVSVVASGGRPMLLCASCKGAGSIRPNSPFEKSLRRPADVGQAQRLLWPGMRFR